MRAAKALRRMERALKTAKGMKTTPNRPMAESASDDALTHKLVKFVVVVVVVVIHVSAVVGVARVAASVVAANVDKSSAILCF